MIEVIFILYYSIGLGQVISVFICWFMKIHPSIHLSNHSSVYSFIHPEQDVAW